MFGNYQENEKVLNLLAPQDITETTTATAYIDVGDAVGKIELMIPFGAMASTDTTDVILVTVEASTAGSSNATEQSIAFKYRKSSAVATDDLGAITASGSTGVEINTNDDDNKTLFLYVDPAALAALGADINWLRVKLAPGTTDVTQCIVGGVHARFTSRYAGNDIPSAT